MNSKTIQHPDDSTASLGVLLVNPGTPDSPSVVDELRHWRALPELIAQHTRGWIDE